MAAKKIKSVQGVGGAVAGPPIKKWGSNIFLYSVQGVGGAAAEGGYRGGPL